MQFHSLHVFDEAYPSRSRLTPRNPLLKRESLRRLAWSVFYLDAMVDAGRHGVHMLSDEGYHIQLPCDESDFIYDRDVITGSPADYLTADSNSLLGLAGHLILVAVITPSHPSF